MKRAGIHNSFLPVGIRGGYMLGGLSTGPWLAHTDTKKTRDFRPGDPLLDASFVAFGPGIEQKWLGRHRLVDVAPTVCLPSGLRHMTWKARSS